MTHTPAPLMLGTAERYEAGRERQLEVGHVGVIFNRRSALEKHPDQM
jgi:hypothetical protein